MATPSAVRAADGALRDTARRLFQPFRLERWLALGFVAVLDQCTQLADSTAQFGLRVSLDQAPPSMPEDAGRWLGAHPLAAVAIAAAVLAVAVGVGAVALWITCRGRFMYIDDVATGRADIRRPWREHAARAASHFTWVLGVALASFVATLALVLPLVWAILALARSGARPVPIVVLVATGFAVLALAVASILFLVAMRDFVAPLQWYADLPAGRAIALFARLLRASPGVFVVYLLLKIVLAMVFVAVAFAACCLTCCLAAVPYLQQTVLQPVLYFERRWSLELLAQLGYGPPAAPSIPPPSEVPPPVATAPDELPPPPPPDEGPSS